MKKLLLVFLVLSICSCKKEGGSRSLKKDIAGTWELEQFVGYPFNQPVLPPGNGRIIILTENGRFERKQNDSLIFRGSYSLRTRKDCYPRNSDIIFSTSESGPDTYQYAEISEGKLVLSTPNCYQDGGNAYYRRVR